MLIKRVKWRAGRQLRPFGVLHSLRGVSQTGYIKALRSYSVLDILLPPIIIITRECSQAWKICKCLWILSCGGESNMMLVLWITFYCHCIWGCMCSTGPFPFRWLKGYSHSSWYYHHQIGSINLTHSCHIFSWLCAWDVCYSIFCHLIIAYTFRETRDFVLIILCSLWWVQIVGYALTCLSCSFVCTLHHLMIIIVQTYLKTLSL